MSHTIGLLLVVSSYLGGRHDVRVSVVDVGVGVVAKCVLVRPHKQGRAVEEVVKGADNLPDQRRVSECKVAVLSRS